MVPGQVYLVNYKTYCHRSLFYNLFYSLSQQIKCIIKNALPCKNKPLKQLKKALCGSFNVFKANDRRVSNKINKNW